MAALTCLRCCQSDQKGGHVGENTNVNKDMLRKGSSNVPDVALLPRYCSSAADLEMLVPPAEGASSMSASRHGVPDSSSSCDVEDCGVSSAFGVLAIFS